MVMVIMPVCVCNTMHLTTDDFIHDFMKKRLSILPFVWAATARRHVRATVAAALLQRRK